jgi:putative endonuclease
LRRYYVYILASRTRVLYIGVTNDLAGRVASHRNHVNPKSFTARYQVTSLVYFEEFREIRDAIVREKELKGWRREKKVRLIEKMNLDWRDLA